MQPCVVPFVVSGGVAGMSSSGSCPTSIVHLHHDSKTPSGGRAAAVPALGKGGAAGGIVVNYHSPYLPNTLPDFGTSLSWLYLTCGILLHTTLLLMDMYFEDPLKRHFQVYIDSGVAFHYSALVWGACLLHLAGRVVDAYARSFGHRLAKAPPPIVLAASAVEHGVSSVIHPVVAVVVHHQPGMSLCSRAQVFRDRCYFCARAVFLSHSKVMIGRMMLLTYLYALLLYIVAVFGLDFLLELDRDHDPAVNLVPPTLMVCSMCLMSWCLWYLAYVDVFEYVVLLVAEWRRKPGHAERSD